MVKIKLLFIISLFILFSYRPVSAQDDLMITEIMQSDIDCYVDDTHEFADSWVELYNPTSEMIYLEGYRMGTSKDPSKAYILPAQYGIHPKSHMVIFCDKRGFNRHTDFRLESGKGSVYLFKGEAIIDKVENFKAQPSPNVSYGRESDLSDVWGYQITPSPAKSNTSGISSIILGSPVFSTPGRVGNTTVNLSLSIPESSPENTVIKYTLDGSEPTRESPEYEEPILIDNNTVVRAKLFCDGAISPRSTTHSYIFHPREMTIPIISLVTNDEFLYSDEFGILSSAITVGNEENYMKDWRRPLNFEFFTKDGKKAEMNQLCETKIKGNATRHYLIKSMVLYANKRFGTKRFNYEFFPDQKKGLDEFKSIEIRNGGNDCYRTYMRDALSQRMMGEYTDLDWQAWRPAVVYINGKYLGILNIRERSNEDNIYSNYDGLEDVEVIQNWNVVEEGTIDNFNEFKNFYREENHSFDEYAQFMDLSEFANYFILNMFVANFDFPGNNMMMWRPTSKDGKWRWICKDMDDSLGQFGMNSDFNYLNWMYHPADYPDYNWACNDESTLLFRRLLDVPEFRDMFINRFAVYTGDFLTDSNTIEKMEEMWNEFKEEWPDHYEINNLHWGPHEKFRNEIKEFITGRYKVIYEQMAEWFGLGTPVPFTVEDPEGLLKDITIQDIALVNPIFTGKWFTGSNVKIDALPAEDKNPQGWIVEVTDNEENIYNKFFNSLAIEVKIPSEGSLRVYPTNDYMEPDTGINGVDDNNGSRVSFYDINGNIVLNTSSLSPGIYIKVYGNKREKILIK